MTKLRFEKFDDQAYHVYLDRVEGSIGTVQKMDDNFWHARDAKTHAKRVCISRGEAAEWLRSQSSK